jgi:hypothetical protein
MRTHDGAHALPSTRRALMPDVERALVERMRARPERHARMLASDTSSLRK